MSSEPFDWDDEFDDVGEIEPVPPLYVQDASPRETLDRFDYEQQKAIDSRFWAIIWHSFSDDERTKLREEFA